MREPHAKWLIEIPLWASAILTGLAGASVAAARDWDFFSWQGVLLAIALVSFLIFFVMAPLLVLKQILEDEVSDAENH